MDRSFPRLVAAPGRAETPERHGGAGAALPWLLAGADRVVFEIAGQCYTGEPACRETRDCQLRPATSFYAGKLRIGLSGRSRAVRSALLARRARCAWTRGSILIAGGAAWIPADCWTQRVAAEAARRLYMRLCAEPRALPSFELPNRWFAFSDRAVAASAIEEVVAYMRADCEDDAFASWRLDRRGCGRFECFGRSPDVPLG